MSKIAKISVEKFDSKEQILYDFDKTKGLEENILNVCRKVGLPESSKIYGLKYLPTKTNDKNHYLSKSNFEEVKHSDCLKVVFSVNYIINRTIMNVRQENLDLRRIAFDDIFKLSLDPVFIEELALAAYDKFLIDVLIKDILSSEEQLGLLKTIVHLFSKNYIQDTTQDILTKSINILKNTDTTNEEIRFTLSLLHKILISANSAFDQWKEKIIKEIPLTEINVYTWRDTSRELQYSALLLINTIIKGCKGEKKLQLIKEMNYRRTRENIYNNIINTDDKLDKNMEHELYVLQTYLLSLFNEALHSKISLDDNSLFKREEFELCTEDMRRITILMDFDENNLQNYDFFSVENLAFNTGNHRISIASTDEISSKRSSSKYFLENDYFDNTISHLTLEALRHYKNIHPKNFYQSQIEEQLYEPGIFATSERVVRMLARMLHIGMDPPDSKSTFYQPVVYYCSPKTPFFLELFSRTMWLLSRTRREMKASRYADYEKVMYVLQKQVKLALKNKPMDFKQLTAELTETSFKIVLEKIQQDKEDEMKSLIDNHPCIQDLKLKYSKENELNVFQQRVNSLLQGEHFPKVLEKKVHGTIFVKLSKNLKELLVYDNNSFKEKHIIEDITHVVIGKNCQHSNLCHNPSLAFAIIVEHEQKIKFIAKDEKTACYWTDALLLLTNKNVTADKLSKYYSEELNELVVMDIRLQLLELQNVVIPKSAPPVPPTPEITRPDIPPKPKPRKTLM
ncbi:unnamed protein product [Ceutorhynchus assimilis]|uniref:PH domain-containing protein n=1 Tax=Ceutorhynchus assimilis TaxID=467358 RepID=A0A9N9MRR8_9CUCU|nr:unnamed protein product [Ceutorhynchus assimilis]